jgi:signal transduction histidine kinase
MRKAHSTQTGRTILVVDDQEDSLISVRRLLERQGHHVVTARSGEEALAVLKEQPVQVALVDYAMPQMSGADLIREIRKRDPFLGIILHTAYCSRYTAHTLMNELGIQGFHDKTDGPDKLLLWIQAALKHRSSIEKLQHHERAHRDLVAHVSHELKNPLHIICGYGDVLLNGAAGTLPAQAEPVVQVIAGKAHDLNEMTSNILLYSKLEAEALEVVPREIELEKLLRGLPDLVSLFLAGKNVGFSADAEDYSLRLTTDGGKVEIILQNLLSNAAKFTHQGSIYLRVATLGPDVRFVVRDSGIGIAREHLEDVFEPFWRANRTTCQDLGGVGLGLAVSRRLALLLGGSLRVTSELGAGSDFTLTLPIVPEVRYVHQMQRLAAKPVNAVPDIKASPSPFGFFRPF